MERNGYTWRTGRSEQGLLQDPEETGLAVAESKWRRKVENKKSGAEGMGWRWCAAEKARWGVTNFNWLQMDTYRWILQKCFNSCPLSPPFQKINWRRKEVWAFPEWKGYLWCDSRRAGEMEPDRCLYVYLIINFESGIISSLIIWKNSPVKLRGSGVFFVEMFLNCSSFTKIILFDFLFLFVLVLIRCVFQGRFLV